VSSKDAFWQTKLHARLHDPAEKALVLLRDPEGHEGGTSRALHRDLGFDKLPVGDWLDPDNADTLDGVLFKKGIPITMYKDVQRADWWAAAADRPQWPMEEVVTDRGKTLKVAPGCQVGWTKSPVLIHPLTGEKLDLKRLAETDIRDIKQRSFDHFSELIVRNGDEVNWRKTLLAFWRFGPELVEEDDGGKLGFLWPLLPSDTRVPDHSIWDHLDLTSAFAGAFAGDGNGDAALLALSLGPVQSFISAARSTSDLWAGSHLLARLSWEAMKVVCERLGPDTILFPRLRDIPQVDVWLRDEMGLPRERFDSDSCEWTKRRTDANPLFAAALPNRFVAVVPADQAESLAADIEKGVRNWLQKTGQDVVKRLLEEIGEADVDDGEEPYCFQQMREQLEGFPEVHWAAVPFSLISPRNKDRQTDLDVSSLQEAMAPFFGAEPEEASGFLASPAWKVLQAEIKWDDNTTFWPPNPGVLYPAVYDLAERALAAAKAVRPFAQLEQGGWRDSLTGESEWLTLDRSELNTPQGQRRDTLWQKIHRAKPSWAKQGEYLGALSAVKRLWPTLFAEEVAETTSADRDQVDRFVVSTHTMALAAQIDHWLKLNENGEENDGIRDLLDKHKPDSVALPRRIMKEHGGHPLINQAKRLPALLDLADDVKISADQGETAKTGNQEDVADIRKAVRKVLGSRDQKLETYYAMILMDGDHMGRILSGDEEYAISYADSFHPCVSRYVKQKAEADAKIADYSDSRRALSPNRHLAISAALNDFALQVVPHIVEREYLGRLIYSGGDDVLAMLPAADLLSAMGRLRRAWSGSDPKNEELDWGDAKRAMSKNELFCKNGFALLGKRLYRMMGERATASCGAVIAHHQAPLAAVRRELADAEKRAKNEGGRNAFSIAIVKRSGGALRLTDKWGKPLALLGDLRDFLAKPSVSRRAAYNCLLWLKDLPPDANEDMLGSLLDYQFQRQASAGDDKKFCREKGLAKRLAKLAMRKTGNEHMTYIENLLGVAEFLAREVRGFDSGSEEVSAENGMEAA